MTEQELVEFISVGKKLLQRLNITEEEAKGMSDSQYYEKKAKFDGAQEMFTKILETYCKQ